VEAVFALSGAGQPVPTNIAMSMARDETEAANYPVKGMLSVTNVTNRLLDTSDTANGDNCPCFSLKIISQLPGSILVLS
jgi:hypothetical protein